MPSANPTPLPLDAAARDFTPISADEAQAFLAHARKDFRSEANELGYVPVQPCDLERLSLTVLALLAAVERGAEDTRDAERYRFLRDNPLGLRAVDGNASLPYCSADGFEWRTDEAMLDAARTPTGADHAE